MFAPVFLLCLTSVFYQTSFGFNLTIIHTNDIHAHVEEMNKYAGECKPEESERGQCFGGVARRLTKVNEIRNANPDHTILLDAGDQFQGTLWFNIYKGIEAATFMNKFNYDAMTFGNHEFDNGVSGLLPFLNMSNFPIINCNMDVSNEPDLQGKFNKSIVIERSGKKIGVIGYLIEETEFLSNPGKTVKFNDVKESMRSEITKLKAQGVDIIIGVGHYGYGNDMRLAKEVDGIDVLVGGHTHSFLYKEAGTKGPSVEKSEGPYPTVVTRPDGKPCLVVQVFFAGKYLGRLHVTFDNQGDVTGWSGLPILLDSSVQPDPAMKSLVEEMAKPLRKEKGKVIGYTPVYLEGSSSVCRVQECNMGNLITDAMVAYHVKSLGQNGEWTDAAIAVLNSGGIRAPIVQGNITRGDILTVQPFGNNVDIITITGLTLKKMLEHSVAKYSNTDRPGAFLQMSGIRVTYDLCRPPGHRVVSVYTRCRNCTVPTYHPLDDDRKYFVVTLDFVIKGGDGYSVLNNKTVLSHNRNNDRDSDVTTKYISTNSPIVKGVEGRISILGDEHCYSEKINSRNDSEVLSHSVVNLEGDLSTCGVRECNLGNLITDAMVAYNIQGSGLTNRWTSSPIAIIDAGSLRSSIQPGNVRNKDVQDAVVSGGTVDVIEISGKSLRSLFEHSMDKNSASNSAKKFLQVSGLRVTYDMCKPRLNRVTSVYTRCSRCDVPKYSILDDEQKYNIAASKSVINGLELNRILNSHGYNDSIFEITAKYLSTMDQVMMGDEGRITILTDCSTSSSQRHRAPIHFIAVFVTLVTSFNIIMKYS